MILQKITEIGVWDLPHGGLGTVEIFGENSQVFQGTERKIRD
jgi:hypothetical protein